MVVLMKCLDEEKAVARCVGDFHDEPWVDRVIVIDGGSTDYTVQELKQFSKVEVYVHPWLDWYHDMEILQSNIALSYVPVGQLCMIMDFDERMSPELKKVLSTFQETGCVLHKADTVHFSRRTWESVRYEDSPHSMLDDDGWPVCSHEIGQYPDYQCRLIRRRVEHRWINSPHHCLIGGEKNVNIQADIIHYEKDDLRDRLRIEKKWARAQARRKQLGLTADKFECNVRPELQSYTEHSTWK